MSLRFSDAVTHGCEGVAGDHIAIPTGSTDRYGRRGGKGLWRASGSGGWWASRSGGSRHGGSGRGGSNSFISQLHNVRMAGRVCHEHPLKTGNQEQYVSGKQKSKSAKLTFESKGTMLTGMLSAFWAWACAPISRAPAHTANITNCKPNTKA